MSYHILHIGDFGCKLTKERGLLVCRKDSALVGKIAIEDLRAVVLTSQAVSISGSVISAIVENDAVIVHCLNYKPLGLTIPNMRTYDARVVLNQAAGNKNLNDAIWSRLLRAKVKNGAACLKNMGVKNCRLSAMLNRRGGELNEAWCAREYWREYFPALGFYSDKRDTQDKSSKPNVLLNYGYGVLGALVHRSIIVSGLNYLLGVNHKTYYKNTPLVYDMIEPFRAFVDYALYNFTRECARAEIRAWAVYFGKFLRDMRVRKGANTLKLMDSIDVACISLANAYRDKKAQNLWVPELE